MKIKSEILKGQLGALAPKSHEGPIIDLMAIILRVYKDELRGIKNDAERVARIDYLYGDYRDAVAFGYELTNMQQEVHKRYRNK